MIRDLDEIIAILDHSIYEALITRLDCFRPDEHIRITIVGPFPAALIDESSDPGILDLRTLADRAIIFRVSA
jgi:hypothetical protein